jgi:UTP--glucose-1-phosphate uridylyltransferase
MLADDLMDCGGPGVMAQMTAAFQKQGRSLLAVQEVPLEHTKRYGIVKGDPLAAR